MLVSLFFLGGGAGGGGGGLRQRNETVLLIKEGEFSRPTKELVDKKVELDVRGG